MFTLANPFNRPSPARTHTHLPPRGITSGFFSSPSLGVTGEGEAVSWKVVVGPLGWRRGLVSPSPPTCSLTTCLLHCACVRRPKRSLITAQSMRTTTSRPPKTPKMTAMMGVRLSSAVDWPCVGDGLTAAWQRDREVEVMRRIQGDKEGMMIGGRA